MYRILFLTFLLAGYLNLSADEPMLSFAGSGTSDDPWLLKTGADVVELANACAGESGATSGNAAGHYAGKYFAVANDIDMSGINGFYGIATAPVGSSPGVSWYFAGVIDGRGHTISNMKIDGIVYDATGKALAAGKTGSRGYVGFVGILKNGGSVQNLHFDSTCEVKGGTESGTVVGHMEAGCTVRDCSSAATVYNLKKNSGGIVGYAKGSSAANAFIFNCVFSGTVKECTEATGGIAGRNERAVVSKCVNLGNVEAKTFNSITAENKQNLGGGIVGYNYFGTVENCLNAGTVTVSNQKAGGIVAYNSNVDCDVHSCVNLGRMVTNDVQYVGAIVGHNFQSGSGANIKHAKISNCYFDSQMWGDPALLTGYRVDPTWITPLPTEEFTSATALEGIPAEHWTYENGFYPRVNTTLLADKIKEAAATYVVFPSGENAGDFTTAARISTAMPGITATMATGEWFTVENGMIVAGLPLESVSDVIQLVNGSFTLDVPVTKVPVTFEGSGTEDDPYLISSKKHLLTLAERCNDKRQEHFAGIWFRQTADIDMDHDNSFKGIASKCINAFNSEQSYYFAGIYDGAGFTIHNLDIEGVTFSPDGTANEYTAGSTGNVGLFGALGTGARIRNVNIATSKISGYYSVGGIAGFMADNVEISNCHVEADILCYNRIAGGIVGNSDGESGSTSLKITGCSFRGSVKANSEIAGGIAGYNHAVIESCVNYGDVTVGKFNACVATPKLVEAGGIVGCNGGNIMDCMNFGNVYSEWSEAGGITGYNTNGYRKGNLERNLSVGQVDAADHTYAGALIGLDYRVNTTSSSELKFAGNYYDSRVCRLLASGNIDKDGLTGLSTDVLTSGNPIDDISSAWTFAQGYYPVPVSLKDDDRIRRAAATYLEVEAPWALYNFGEQGLIPSVMQVTASFVGDTDVFTIDGNYVKAPDVTTMAVAKLKLTNGDFSRTLTLTKAGAILPGKGTADDPYIIATADDFNKVAGFVTDNSFGFPGFHFLMTADIDFGETPVRPVSGASTSFAGVFDGGDHTISNAVVDNSASTDPNDASLFPYLGQNGVIRNLNVVSSSFKGGNYVAAIAAHCMGQIENCSTADDVVVEGVAGLPQYTSTGNEIGGVVGRVYPTASIIDCENGAAVTGNTMVGGIAGASRDALGATIVNCTNKGKITGTADREIVIQGGQEVARYVETMAGGIAGRFTGGITGCVNEGEVLTTVCNAVGGILGKAFIKADITDCVNRGKVYAAYSYGGGIIGITTVNSGTDITTTITGCSNEGEVSGLASIGGVAGVAANGCAITRSRNIALVNPLMGRGGGIVGEISQHVVISDSYNAGEISASMLAGGIVGDAPKNTDVTIDRCFNTGNVTAGNNGGASGIVNVTAGTQGAVTISDCYNNGDIAAARFAAGIAGRCDGAVVNRCYSSGIVESTSENETYRQSVGNIVADPSAKVVLNDCCYLDHGTELAADANFDNAIRLTATELFGANDLLGAAYVYNAGSLALPMLAGFADEDAAKASAVYFVLGDGDNIDDVKNNVALGSLAGTEWSVDGPFIIDVDKLVPKGEGEAILTAVAGDFSRSYRLVAASVGKIEDISTEIADGEVTYYTVSGVRADGTSPRGTVLIKIVTDTNGRSRAEKVIVK